MATPELQLQIFQHIKSKVSPAVNMADEIAGVLDISTDSAYRRIRGEKPLSIEELYKLCLRYGVSLDSLFNLESNAFAFQGKLMQPSTFRFDEYLVNLVQQVKYMNSFRQRQMYYLCKDIPIFHHFHFRELAAFKYYFWMRAFMQQPGFAQRKFSFADYPDELFQLGQQALHYYNQIDSVELWNIETIISTVRQIKFYQDTQAFTREEDIYALYSTLEKLLDHLEAQAALGYKFNHGDKDQTPLAAYAVYYNEVILGDNSILVSLDGSKAAFIVHSIFNFMLTRDVRFCDNLYEQLQNLMSKSTLISSVSELERSRFFKHLRQRITARKEGMKA